MLMTAEQAREVMLDSINYYNEPEVYIEKQIAESAYSGKSEYIYDDMLPLYLKDILETHGYTITQEWYEDVNKMLSAIDAYNIAQGTYPKELKYIEDTIRTAAKMRMTCCIIKEEITEAAEQILKDMGYNVQIISLYGGYITYINWAKG